MSRSLTIRTELDPDGGTRLYAVGGFPERLLLNHDVLAMLDPRVCTVEVLFTPVLENGAATYAWRNDLDGTEGGAFVMRRTALYTPEEERDGAE